MGGTFQPRLTKTINALNFAKKVGLSGATLEFQVCKMLSIVKTSKLDPSVSKICCQKNWLKRLLEMSSVTENNRIIPVINHRVSVTDNILL